MINYKITIKNHFKKLNVEGSYMITKKKINENAITS
jgi:hypothetical protein